MSLTSKSDHYWWRVAQQPKKLRLCISLLTEDIKIGQQLTQKHKSGSHQIVGAPLLSFTGADRKGYRQAGERGSLDRLHREQRHRVAERQAAEQQRREARPQRAKKEHRRERSLQRTERLAQEEEK